MTTSRLLILLFALGAMSFAGCGRLGPGDDDDAADDDDSVGDDDTAGDDDTGGDDDDGCDCASSAAGPSSPLSGLALALIVGFVGLLRVRRCRA